MSKRILLAIVILLILGIVIYGLVRQKRALDVGTRSQTDIPLTIEMAKESVDAFLEIGGLHKKEEAPLESITELYNSKCRPVVRLMDKKMN